MDLERLHDGPDLLADRVRQFEIFHAGTCGNRLEPAAPALSAERLKGDIGPAPRGERPKARRLATKRTYRGYSSSGSSSSSTGCASVSAVGAAWVSSSRRARRRFFRERTIATTAR